MTDTEEALKSELLRLDILLRRKQTWWEHPRNFAIILGVVAAIAGVFGFKVGTQPPQPIIIHITKEAIP